MAAEQQVTQLIIDARGAEEGSAAYVRALKAAQTAVDKSIDIETRLQGAIQKSSIAMTGGAGAITTVQRRWDALVASVDPVAAAHQKAAAAIEKATLQADAAVRRLGVSQDQAGAIVQAVREKYQALTAEVERNTVANQNNAGALERMRAQYDPTFAAQIRHRDAIANINIALKEAAISEELAATARRKATSEMNDTIQKLERLGQVQKEAAQRQVNQQLIVPDRGADIAAYATEMDRLRAKFDPLFRAQQGYRAELEELRRALAVGALSQDAYGSALERLKAGFADQVRTIRGVGTATQETSALVVRSAAEMQRALDAAGRAGSEAFARMQANVSASNRLGSLSYSTGSVANDATQSAARAQYDQLYAAGLRYKESLAQLRAELQTGAITEQLYAAQLARTKAAFVEQAAALGALSREQREHAQAAEAAAKASKIDAAADAAAKSTLAYAESLRAMRAELVPTYAAQQEFDTAVTRANQALAAGVISQTEHGAAIGRARARLLDQTNEMRKAEEANERLTRGVGLNAYAWQNLSYQVNDVVTSLASGISPFQTLAQQGGQIFQILQSGQGGVGGALRGIGQALLSLGPGVAIVGTLTVALVAAAAAAISYSNAQNQMKNALLGSGQAAGLTVDQLGEIARQAADTGKVTIGTAREIERAFLSSGQVLGDAFLPGILAVQNLSKATGQDAKTAAENLAQSLGRLDDGGLEDLARKAGNFDTAFTAAVRELLAAGREAEAQIRVVNRLNDAYKQAGENAAWYQRAWQTVLNNTSSMWDSLGRKISGAGDTASEQIRKLETAAGNRETIGRADAQSRGKTYSPDSDPEVQRLRQKAAALRQEQDKLNADARKSGEQAQSAISQSAQRAVEAAVPDISRYRKLGTDLADVSKEMGRAIDERDRGVSGAAANVDRLKAAQDRLKQSQEDLRAAGSAENIERRKALEISLAAAQQLRAVTPEEKASAASAMTRAQAIGTVTSAQERNTAADRAYKESLDANNQATTSRIRVTLSGAESQDRFSEALKNGSQSIVAITAAETARQQVADGTISKTREQEVRESELRKGLADTQRAISERVRSQQDSVDSQNKANAAVRSGQQSSEQAARQMQVEEARRKGLREAQAAEGAQREQLVKTIEQEAEAGRALISSQNASAALSMTEQVERQITATREEIAVIGKSREEQAKTIATRQAMIDLMRQGIDVNSAEGQGYIAAQQRLAGYRVELQKAAEAQYRMQEGQRAIGDAFTSFIDNLVTGSGKLTDALASLAKTFTSGGLQAIFTGTGPFAEMFGTASGDPNKQGGLLGGILPGLRDAVKSGTEAGSSTGIMGGFNSLFGTNFDTKQIVGGLGGILSIAGSYGAGAQAKSAGGAMLSGALSGGVGGFMLGSQIGAIGGPIGAIAGAAIGGLMSLFGFNDQKKQQRQQQLQQYKDQYEQAKPQIETLSRTLRGAPTSGTEATIEQARLQMVQAAQTAAKGGDQATATRIEKEWYQYRDRLRQQVRDAMDGTMKDIAAGFGPQGPFATAAAQVHQLGDAMRAWLDDVNSATGAFSDAGLDAIFKGLLATLQPTPELSATAKEFQRIQGTAAGLQQELERLGITSDQAAAAIREGVGKAMETLRNSFNSDLDVKINEANGKDYLNDAADLIKEVATLRVDAGTIGGDLNRVNTYFAAAAQKIVNENELAGESYKVLIAQYPQLNGLIHEYTAAIEDQAAAIDAAKERMRGFQDRLFAATNDTTTLAGQLRAFDRAADKERLDETKAGGQAMADLEAALAAERLNVIKTFEQQAAAAEKAIADRRLGYADRLFAAQNDTSTLAGQLAAYDRRAAQERAAEVEAGGQALIDLEQAQAAERLKIEQDYYSQVVDAQVQAFAQAQQAFDTFARNIKTFVDGLRAGSNSPLSPQARLTAAQSQYDAQLVLARSGDRAALDGITAYASDLLDAAKGFYASSSAFQTIFGQVTGQLTALPTQVSPEQFIVNAINDSKTATVAATQALQTSLKTAIDAGNASATAAALLPQFNTLTATTGGLLNYSQFVAATGGLATVGEQQAARNIFNEIDRNGDGQIDKMEAVRAQALATAANTGTTSARVDRTNAIMDAVNAILGVQKVLLDNLGGHTYNTAVAAQGTKAQIEGSNAILGAINSLNAQQKAVQDAIVIQTLNTAAGVGTSNGILGQLQAINTTTDKSAADTLGQMFGLIDLQRKALFNLQSANGKNGAIVHYASGGLITGPGTGTSDDISARLSNGEFVLTAEATRRLGVPFLDGLNDNRIAMPTVAMPLAPGMTSGALVAEVRALRAEVSALRKERQQGDAIVTRAVVAGAEHVAEHIDRTTDAVEDGQRTAAVLAA